MLKTLLLGSVVVTSLGGLVACSPAPTQQAAAPAPAPAPATPPTEAEAIAVVNKAPTALMAGDINGAVDLFTTDALLIDPASNDLITTPEGNRASTEAFMKAGAVKFSINSQKAQILDANTFVVTSVFTADMKQGGKTTQAVFRITDVGHKQANGEWKLVNEHISAAPMPVTSPLPVVGTFELKTP